MMNWKEIAEKYPKAWDAFLIWVEDGVDVSHICGDSYMLYYISGGYISPRILYGFFDEQELYIEIGIDMPKKFYSYVHSSMVDLGYHLSRHEAEEAAFTKAFELLEEKQKKQ